MFAPNAPSTLALLLQFYPRAGNAVGFLRCRASFSL
jgi:hypothetical protein